jgi:thymidine phosphorylase
LIAEIKKETIPDYQISSLLMTITLKGMSEFEVLVFTQEMIDSQTLFHQLERYFIVDKHSTGGIGDGITFLFGAILGSLGIDVFKMSGKGIGITGGTIDKLNSIPGFQPQIPYEKALMYLKQNHLVIMSQTSQVCSVDAKLYSLRDVTGTATSIPLIAISVMCKKLSFPSKLIILDIK